MSGSAPSAERAPVVIRPFRLSDASAFVAHLGRHMRESGRRGAPHFAPRSEFDPEEMRNRVLLHAGIELDEPGWERVWLAWTADREPGRPSERVVGHVDLRGGRLRAELHRAVLGLGLERAFWRRGLGEQLTQTALHWARDEARLAWVDLFVFGENAPARALYLKLGFEERGTLEDAFRLQDGTIVSDVRMTLRLRDTPAASDAR